ncbi:hypothetical protein EHS25_007793 [Saitozyma podzolica]|uniref:Uncharacterized protein n=1 Tax=Saitozyma podzolica TaxID=1890683 RepID=A0A427YQU4_9TREE|nr:hypothetical protein EHS25_007793 [Saitozyma podzolica]
MPHSFPPQPYHSSSAQHTKPQHPNPPPRPPLGTPRSSAYLSPIQEERILAWRSHTSRTSSPSDAGPAGQQQQVQSAPASLAFSAQSSVTCPRCGKGCGCATERSLPTPSSRQKSYYRRSKGHRTRTHGQLTPVTPMTSAFGHMHDQTSPVVRQPDSGSTPAPAPPRLASISFRAEDTPLPDKNGLPSREQIEGYTNGTSAPLQVGSPHNVFPAEREQARPSPQGAARIAGVRDPISTN